MTRYELRSSLQKRTVHERRFTSISELKNEFLCAFSEIDTVGVIIDADSVEQDAQYKHTIYMADLAHNIMAVKFRSNLKVSSHNFLIVINDLRRFSFSFAFRVMQA